MTGNEITKEEVERAIKEQKEELHLQGEMAKEINGTIKEITESSDLYQETSN